MEPVLIAEVGFEPTFLWLWATRLNRLATPPLSFQHIYYIINFVESQIISFQSELNQQPAHYRCAALPIELWKHKLGGYSSLFYQNNACINCWNRLNRSSATWTQTKTYGETRATITLNSYNVGGRIWTGTLFRALDFKSKAAACYATPTKCFDWSSRASLFKSDWPATT